MKFILVLFFFFSSFLTLAQDKIWFDANGNITTKENAVYYRVSSKNKTKKQLIIDYYISGKKAKESYFVKGKQDGKYVEFYNTGEVKVTGVYQNGLKTGMWKTYDKKGKIKKKGKYFKGEKVGVWKTFYKNN
ncbi:MULTISPECIES: toxin-antitoxin system YwqK family antitoxin [Polaribacter]|uniref:Toxin-antitoxin system YwqK family antitoxin n=1 Tax=Polaribacter marinaquae TaxID=1642819 RepID=A0ABZ2TVF9_9FLAO